MYIWYIKGYRSADRTPINCYLKSNKTASQICRFFEVVGVEITELRRGSELQRVARNPVPPIREFAFEVKFD